MNAKTVILPGGSGFLGQALASFLTRQNYTPIILTRGPSLPATENSPQHIHWDATTSSGDWTQALNNAHAVINLVGRTVNCRKTPAHKKEILDSRILSTRALAQAWQCAANPPKIWIQTSTAHIYGDTHDEILDESSPTGTGFAPDVGRAWEKEFGQADLKDTRRVILRVSFVMGIGENSALKTLARLTRLFLGGHTGSGRQWMSWLHLADYCEIILRALRGGDPTMQGIYVVTAPNPVTNKEFMRQLRRTLHRPWSPPIPKPFVHIGALLMRTDPELALFGRRCMPTRLLNEGFQFQFPTLPEALHDLLG
ncbi:MAG TPA: TIGR01777 family oxidoreductase [Tepidisphaeraceae bacterium]|nr:TIGR01777 family oxidoreductase [Tepidisphaeraceae bacterium]